MGYLHVAAAVAALLAGLEIVRRPKGTSRHRLTGRLYLLVMAAVNVSALTTYEQSGSFGAFHWLALVSLATLSLGVAPMLGGAPSVRSVHLHAHFMSWSYAGLVAAGTSQLTSHIPGFASPWTVPLTSLAVFAVAGLVIARNVPGAIRTTLRRLSGSTEKPPV
jgi:uncharacterized membrane protein